MFVGDFNGDGIQDALSDDAFLGDVLTTGDSLGTDLFGKTIDGVAWDLRELRVLFGNGETEPYDVALENWQVAGVVGEFYREFYDTSQAFGYYPIAEDASSIDYIFENLSAYVEVVTGAYGNDGIKVDYLFSGFAQSSTVVVETYYDETYYYDEPAYESEDADFAVYYWFDGTGWVAGDADGIDWMPDDASFDSRGEFGTLGDDVLAGTAVDNVIYALAGDDVIDGRGGDDYIEGGLGDDYIDGNGGSDSMHGNEGNDTFKGGKGAFEQYYGGEGVDLVDFSGLSKGYGLKISLASGDGQFFDGSGDMVFNSIEQVIGGRGDDRIQGQDGVVQTLDGHEGDDRLFGADQADTLIDGAGRDNMHGRGGADTFLLVSDGDRDTISDFEIGVDQIDITEWGVSDGADLIFDAHTKKSGRVTVSFEDETLLIKTQDLAADISVDDFIF